jgi:hypothetical protein
MKKNILDNLIKKALKEELNIQEIENVTINQADGDNICESHFGPGSTMVPDSLDCSGPGDCTITCVVGNTTQTVTYKTSKKPMKKGENPADPRPIPPKPNRKPTVGMKEDSKRKSKKGYPARAIKEAEVTAGESQTQFKLKVDVSNKQSETKLGIRIQLEPKDGFLESDVRDKVEVALSKKLNNALEQFDMQVSKDTDVPDPTIIGFFIPLSQIKNMIVKSIKGPGGAKVSNTQSSQPTQSPSAAPVPTSKPTSPSEPLDETINKMISEELINEMRQRTLNEISKIVIREDFYNFINAGNNMLRSLEEKSYDMHEAKNYLKYLVKHNIM